ncbi:phosphopentomutase [Syntrophomonas wolfei]|nr:phosphopentomutase [Syntrophomonas wolfei]
MTRRAILIVLDSAGIGEMEDSSLYGDQGSNTIVNTARAVGGLELPRMQSLGLGNLDEIPGVEPVQQALGAYGKMKEKSPGKDSTTGHWEMMGQVLKYPFPTYPHAFPPDLIEEFERRIQRKTLGNVVASGTEIIERLGPEHMKTACPIVYTSADSVFQVAAHEELIPLAELYAICHTAREMLAGENAVGRVIARPFTGHPGAFQRTPNRHDFSLAPERSILDAIIEAGQQVIAIGKIYDLFAGRGVSESRPSKSNRQGIELIIAAIKEESSGLIFANLLDFDQVYGHRNDVEGYARALEEFDAELSNIMSALKPGDLLFISADHGCDPTTPSTDHSREMVPVLVYGRECRPGVDLGIRESFADLGQSIAEHIGVPASGLAGKSFYPLIRGLV